jgi:cyclophilin family peptidyl-prolyl cis-trans isomerase
MKHLRVLVMVAISLVACLGFAQEYSVKAGETVMKVAIEGRGNLYIKLFTDKAPKATSHIMSLVRKRFYDGQKIFRVERSPRPFLIQMGAPGSKSKSLDDEGLQTEGTGARIPFEETGYKFDRKGMVGLSAQKGDRDSGDCLFHVVLGPTTFLNGNYTVFGMVVGGMDLLDRIEKGDKIVSVTLLGG